MIWFLPLIAISLATTATLFKLVLKYLKMVATVSLFFPNFTKSYLPIWQHAHLSCRLIHTSFYRTFQRWSHIRDIAPFGLYFCYWSVAGCLKEMRLSIWCYVIFSCKMTYINIIKWYSSYQNRIHYQIYSFNLFQSLSHQFIKRFTKTFVLTFTTIMLLNKIKWIRKSSIRMTMNVVIINLDKL